MAYDCFLQQFCFRLLICQLNYYALQPVFSYVLSCLNYIILPLQTHQLKNFFEQHSQLLYIKAYRVNFCLFGQNRTQTGIYFCSVCDVRNYINFRLLILRCSLNIVRTQLTCKMHFPYYQQNNLIIQKRKKEVNQSCFMMHFYSAIYCKTVL